MENEMEKRNLLVPGWVYDLADYRQMFDLTEEDLKKRILDFPGGISSFNAQMHANGYSLLSGDPNYVLESSQMSQLAEQILSQDEANLRSHRHHLRKSDEASIQKILESWNKNKNLFLSDYSDGKKDGRYQAMELPRLPFNDFYFELVLCTDLLFHAHARGGLSPNALMAELSRIAVEVRIFPILDENHQLSEAIGPLMLEYQKQDYGIELREVPFEIKKGGNAMLRFWSKKCVVPKVKNHV